MQPPNQPSEERSDPGASVLRDQRDANEQLVLAALRASEEVEEARSARFRAEEETHELRTTTEELRTTAEFRERLIGIIGHDLRTPLNAMTMAGGLLIAHGNLSEDDSRLANRIVDSGHRVSRMITQLVEFTRARLGGGFMLCPVFADLEQICCHIAEELRIGSSVEIRETTEGDVTGAWDVDRLSEVMSNLAGNAVDHATPGTPVLIHTRADGAFVVAEVSNQGAGIAPDALDSIFKPFRRIDSDEHGRAGHLGLGLYIASEIVSAHGGTVTAWSAEGTTTFTVRLPRSGSTRAGI